MMSSTEQMRHQEAAQDPAGGVTTVRSRTISNFTAISLGILGVVQGVSLGQLAGVVANNYRHFSVLQWLMAGVTLFFLVVVWYHLAINAMVFNWVPDFTDAALPLMIGAVELFLIYAVVHGVRVWLAAMIFVALCALLEIRYVGWRAGRFPDDNDPQVLDYVHQRWTAQGLVIAAGLAVYPLLAVASLLDLFRDTPDIHGYLATAAVLFVWGWLAAFATTGRNTLWRYAGPRHMRRESAHAESS
jgi:hypothetical protein